MKPLRQIHLEEQADAGRRDSARRQFRPGDGFRAMATLLLEWACRAWWASPFHYWGQPGLLWSQADHPATIIPQSWADFFDAHDADPPSYPPGLIRAPFGGMIEAVIRRRRRCVSCGKWFWRRGSWNPLAGVNIFEEHCSKACADDELDSLPY